VLELAEQQRGRFGEQRLRACGVHVAQQARAERVEQPAVCVGIAFAREQTQHESENAAGSSSASRTASNTPDVATARTSGSASSTTFFASQARLAASGTNWP
jgi:hypothetical protein